VKYLPGLLWQEVHIEADEKQVKQEAAQGRQIYALAS
jgi:hypothetical protein